MEEREEGESICLLVLLTTVIHDTTSFNTAVVGSHLNSQ